VRHPLIERPCVLARATATPSNATCRPPSPLLDSTELSVFLIPKGCRFGCDSVRRSMFFPVVSRRSFQLKMSSNHRTGRIMINVLLRFPT
jgi:hypothetical protein